MRIVAADDHHAVETPHARAVQRQDGDAGRTLRGRLLVRHRFEQGGQHRAEFLLAQRGMGAGLVVGQLGQPRERVEHLPAGIVGGEGRAHIERVQRGVEPCQPDRQRLLRQAARPRGGLVGQRGDQRARAGAGGLLGLVGIHRLGIDQRGVGAPLGKQMTQARPAAGNGFAANLALHQRDGAAAVGKPGQAERALEQVEQRGGVAIARQDVEPAHQRRGRPGGGELPAGFVAHRRTGAGQQRAGPAGHHAVMRDQRHVAAAFVQPLHELVGSGGGLVLEARAADHTDARAWFGELVRQRHRRRTGRGFV
ncbi:hypothetical protein D3C87_1158760 [compost metagenome]